MVVGRPFLIEGFEGVRDEGKEDREPCRLRLLLAVPLVPLVEGLYESTEVMFKINAAQKLVSWKETSGLRVETYVHGQRR